MEIAVCMLAVAVVILCGLLIREIRLRKLDKLQYEKNDKMLTQYVANNLDMEKKLTEMQHDYERQQNMAEEIRRMQEQSRLLKHDMKNHTLVMLSYLEENRTEEAKKYASDILDKLNKMYTYVNVGNSLLNYIMNNKLSKAKECGIDIKAEIENLPFNYMDSVDLSSLLNNMLDNALQGAMTSEEKKLEVRIISQKGFDCITVKNSIATSVMENNPELVSTKTEPGHGYGIKQIRMITEKYNGIMDIYEENKMFIVSVMLCDS